MQSYSLGYSKYLKKNNEYVHRVTPRYSSPANDNNHDEYSNICNDCNIIFFFYYLTMNIKSPIQYIGKI